MAKAEVPEPILAPAPIQLAQAPVPAIQAAPVVAPIVQQAQGSDEWTKFRGQMAAKEEQPMELNFGPGYVPAPVITQVNPVVLPNQRIEPNFAAFSRWQRKTA